MGVDILQALLAVDPDKRVAAFEEAVIDLSDASGSCSAASGQDALEIGHAGLFALAGASFPPRLRSVLRDAALPIPRSILVVAVHYM